MLRLVGMGRMSILATPALEYEEVLARPEQRAIHGLSTRQVERFLTALASAIEPVTIHIAWRPQLSDPADEMVLEAAINGRADAIVTFNVKDFIRAGRFGISIVRPVDLLDRIRQ